MTTILVTTTTTLLLLCCCWSVVVSAFAPTTTITPLLQRHVVVLSNSAAASSSKESFAWDDDVDYDKEWPDSPDNDNERKMKPLTDFLARVEDNNDGTAVQDDDDNVNRLIRDEILSDSLGIDLNLEFSPDELEGIKAQARDIVERRVQQSVDEVKRMRQRMNREIERNRQSMTSASEQNARRQGDVLLNKIDRLTNQFLQSTQPSRQASKLAAAADQSMQGKGLEYGSWGTLVGDDGNDMVIPMMTDGGTDALLGSVDNAIVQQERRNVVGEASSSSNASPSNRILIVADESKDPIAKKVLPSLTEELRLSIAGIEIEVLKPSATMPLGGNNAACVLLFLPSLSANPKSPLLERLLRRTMLPGGQVSRPPTQLVAVSTLGTERTDKFPYSMQNLMGRPLDQRRQAEESIIGVVRNRMEEPFLDYTIVKVGEIKDGNAFDFQPGDVLDGTTSLETATQVLVQAIAFQPNARNATVSVVGNMPPPSNMGLAEWDDLFLKLAGPELYRGGVDTPEGIPVEKAFDQLSEYLVEWATLLAKSTKLITPVRAERVVSYGTALSSAVTQRSGVKLLFQPTKTGRNYMSKEEELARERETGQTTTSNNNSPPRRQKTKPEGGVEIMVEITHTNELRVRARRCNMADDTVVKELSEESILKRLEESLAGFQM